MEATFGKSTYQFIDRDYQEFSPKKNWPRGLTWVVIQPNEWTSTFSDEGERLLILRDFYEFDDPTKGTRERKKAESGNKVEGRKSYLEKNSQLVRQIQQLRRFNLLTKKRIRFQNIAENSARWLSIEEGWQAHC